MALKNVKEIDDKLAKMYENQVTTKAETPKAEFIDKSEDILKYMNFVAINNKSFLNLK